MKVSVIVPVYNADKYLNRCVDSILNQTISDIELILVNDGSTDNSGSICDEYVKKDSRVKVVHTQNRGVSAARNTGIDISAGEYLGFVDADDYIELNMYEKLLVAAESNNADVVCCGYYREEREIIYEKHREDSDFFVSEGTPAIFKEYLRQDYDNGFGEGNWNKIFKKNSVGSIRYSNHTHGEDVEFQIEVFKKAKKVVCISDLLYHYICNDGSASMKKFSKKNLDILEISDNLVEYIKEEYPENEEVSLAFQLTWYMSVLQKIYESSSEKENSDSVNRIRQTIKSDCKRYTKNAYAKRLDKYLAYALVYNVVEAALKFRQFVRNIRQYRVSK